MTPSPTPLSVGEAIRKTQYYLRVKIDDALRSLNLTSPQYFALAALSAQPGLSGAALARRCFVTPQTMTGIIANLAAAGLIDRAPDPEHGRIIQTRLTTKGAVLLAQGRVAVEHIETDMVRDLDRAEREALADLLLQCAEALARRASQQPV
jgi:DNA-binding MarR family transcriptional regulator